jgi:hypothetical protein
MDGRRETTGRVGPEPESYGKLMANLASVLVALAGLALVIMTGRPPSQPKTVPQPAPPTATVARSEVVIVKSAEPSPPTPEPPKLDRAAVAKAEGALDAAGRERARAEARAEDAAHRLAEASIQAAADSRAAKTLAFRVRDPSTRLTRVAARGNFLKAERDRLKTEVATLATVPRPKAKILSNKNPVARPADGDEHHFELRRNRVSCIDLERLLTLVKSDAQLRIRLSSGSRMVDSKIGPVGAFSMQYILARTMPGGLEELMERRGISYELRAWEIVPEFDGRGETFEASRQPLSEFARTINRLSPLKASITMWIYPDSFALYRKLRDDLQSRGFLVAARPLPEGMAIRGSPSGSLSAGQ